MRRLAVGAVALLALVSVSVLGCSGGDSDDTAPAATLTATQAVTTSTQPPATPSATPAAPAPAPATATPTPTPARAPGTTGTVVVEGNPFSLEDFESALPSPGLVFSDEFEPVCPGASGEPIVFTGSGAGMDAKHAVWVLWIYADRDAFEADWAVGEDFRVRPLLDGCEPPNGFVYWHENLILWFAGFYGSEVAPGSLPATAEEVRSHPVVQAFLELTWQ